MESHQKKLESGTAISFFKRGKHIWAGLFVNQLIKRGWPNFALNIDCMYYLEPSQLEQT